MARNVEMTSKVNVSNLECADGSVIGVLELDNPAALNALSYVMIEQLYNQLLEWQIDDNIVAVCLHAQGEKAFCAGGDIQAIYRALENKEQDFNSALSAMKTFFDLEYRCDHLIHTYSKPIIAWGHGYLMGGGGRSVYGRKSSRGGDQHSLCDARNQNWSLSGCGRDLLFESVTKTLRAVSWFNCLSD